MCVRARSRARKPKSRAPSRRASMEDLPPDPLLKPGTFIDPTTAHDGYHHPDFAPDPSDVLDPDPKPTHQPDPSIPVHSSPNAGTSEAAPHSDRMNADSEVPDWLPPGWRVEFRVRSSGASAGHRDKYYYYPGTTRRFRSKKEVLAFLETGEIGSKKKKHDGSDAESTPPSSKRKKAAPKARVENFKFNEVPEKVKWVLTDVYEVSWRPLVGGAERVPKQAKLEWDAAFRYLTLQKNGNATASLA